MEGLKRLLEPFYREAEFWLLNAPQKEIELKRLTEEILHSGGSTSIVGTAHETGNISDPTGEKAKKLAELERERRWLELIKEVERTPYGDLIRLRREYGRPSRRNPVWPRMARKLRYSERWLREQWREIVFYTAFLAVSKRIA